MKSRFRDGITSSLDCPPDGVQVNHLWVEADDGFLGSEQDIYGLHAGQGSDGVLNVQGALSAVHALDRDLESSSGWHQTASFSL